MSLRLRLVLVVALAVVPATGLTLDQALRDRDIQRQEALSDLMVIALAASREQELFVESTGHLLRGLAVQPEVLGTDPVACTSLLDDILATHEDYLDLSVVDAQGQVRCSASAAGSLGASVQDRPFFLRAVSEGGFVVGRVHPDPDNERATLVLAQAVGWLNGTVEAVVAVEADLEGVSAHLVQNGLLPSGAAVILLDAEGIVVDRYPEGSAWIGRKVPDAPLAASVLASPQGHAQTGGLDDVRRVYAFTTLGSLGQGGGLRFVVGIPESQVFGPADEAFARNLATLGVAAALIAAAAWVLSDRLVARPVRQLASAARRIGAGDLGARSGVPHHMGDFGGLAADFDAMAASLQAHTAREEETRARLEAGNRRLQELEAMKTTFINRAAHQLRTPLTGVRLQAHLLRHRSRGRLDAAQERSLGLLEGDIARLERVVQDLVAASRVMAGRLRLVTAPVDLGVLLGETARGHAGRAASAGVRFEVEAPQGLMVQADEGALARALHVVLENALEHSPKGGVVRAEARAEDACAVVRVADTGQGLSREQLAALFPAPGNGAAGSRGGTGSPAGGGNDPSLAPRAPSRGAPPPGAGMELFLAWGILQAHGGRLEVRSDGPGLGSEVALLLPLASVSPPADAERGHGGHPEREGLARGAPAG